MSIKLVKPDFAEPVAVFSVPDLAAEANHRIANNLSLIAGLVRLKASSIANGPETLPAADVRLILEEFGERVETVARLHRVLADTHRETTVDLGEFLERISTGVVESLSFAGHADLTFDIQSACSVDPQQALPIGFIVAEVITNAIKYAHPTGISGLINVGCYTGPAGKIVIEISDDGVGLPEGFDPMTSGHLGFRVVRALADQLCAAIDFTSTPLGLTVVLQLPGPRLDS